MEKGSTLMEKNIGELGGEGSHRLGIYRRYPLGRLPALRNAWRITRDGSAASLRSAGHDTPLGMAISLYTDDPDVL